MELAEEWGHPLREKCKRLVKDLKAEAGNGPRVGDDAAVGSLCVDCRSPVGVTFNRLRSPCRSSECVTFSVLAGFDGFLH